ncbi:hypothetical protein KR009_005877, partial [Drosophila setifemur]
VNALVEFTNLNCESLDKKFSDFEYCILKSVNRTFKYISLKVKLFKVPIKKIKVNFAMYKRYNGYKPFMYNNTVDACKFLEKRNSDPLTAFFYGFFKNCSNMNHTCPYDHDLVVDKLSTQIMNHRVTEVLPFPDGNYMIQTNWIAYDIHRAIVKVHFALS